MSFSWFDYLKLAKDLVTIDDEAAQRSAISRAYYFVFHLAQDRAKGNGLLAQTTEGHKQTWDCFIASPDAECKRLGLIGQRLRSRRNKADYDDPYAGKVSEEAEVAVNDAVRFHSKLMALPSRYPKV